MDMFQDFPELVRDHYNTYWMGGGLSYSGDYLGKDRHEPFPIYVSAFQSGDRSQRAPDGGEAEDWSTLAYLDTHPARFSEACTEADKQQISRYLYLSMTDREVGWSSGIKMAFELNRDWEDVRQLVNQHLPEGYVLY